MTTQTYRNKNTKSPIRNFIKLKVETMDYEKPGSFKYSFSVKPDRAILISSKRDRMGRGACFRILNNCLSIKQREPKSAYRITNSVLIQNRSGLTYTIRVLWKLFIYGGFIAPVLDWRDYPSAKSFLFALIILHR